MRAQAQNPLRLDVWTVNDPDEAATFVAAGVDGVITDVPDAVLAALGPG